MILLTAGFGTCNVFLCLAQESVLCVIHNTDFKRCFRGNWSACVWHLDVAVVSEMFSLAYPSGDSLTSISGEKKQNITIYTHTTPHLNTYMPVISPEQCWWNKEEFWSFCTVLVVLVMSGPAASWPLFVWM